MTTYENMWTFGPLWSSPQSLTLQVDWFIVFTSTTEMIFTVEWGDDPQVGDRWPLDVHLMANGFPVHITSVELADPSADDYGTGRCLETDLRGRTGAGARRWRAFSEYLVGGATGRLRPRQGEQDWNLLRPTTKLRNPQGSAHILITYLPR